MSAYSSTQATGADGKRSATSLRACTTRRRASRRDAPSTPPHRSSVSLTKSYVASARTPAHRSRRASRHWHGPAFAPTLSRLARKDAGVNRRKARAALVAGVLLLVALVVGGYLAYGHFVRDTPTGRDFAIWEDPKRTFSLPNDTGPAPYGPLRGWGRVPVARRGRT